MRVLVDASFLILCAEAGRDFIRLAEDVIGEPIEPYVTEEVLNELRSIAGRGGRRGQLASIALEIASRMNVIGGGDRIPADMRLLQEATRLKAAIATMDINLIRRARSLGIPVISVGSDMRVIFEGVRL
jgi:rRNA-processing protein FCF1